MKPTDASPEKKIIIAGPNGAGKTTFENLYKPLVDQWALYDNSGSEPVLIEEGVNDER
jgi:predicted ABC-type ATPase